MGIYHGVNYVDAHNVKATSTGVCIKWDAAQKATIKADKLAIRQAEDLMLAAQLQVTVQQIKAWRRSMIKFNHLHGNNQFVINGRLKGCSCKWDGGVW